MNRKISVYPLIVVMGLMASIAFSEESSPSFDCSRAKSADEKIICQDHDLASSDRSIAILYNALPACLTPEEMARVRDAQRQWLLTRAACANHVNEKSESSLGDTNNCLEKVYGKRFTELTALNDKNCTDVRISEHDSTQKVYRDKRYHFEFTFPANLQPSTAFEVSYLVPERKWDLFSHEEGIPVINVLVNSRAEVRIGVHPGKTEKEACGWDEKVKPEEIRQMSGHLFHITEIADGGMCHSIRGTNYMTFYEGYCYAINSFALGSCTADAKSRAATAVELKKAQQISESFKFFNH